MKHFRTVIKAVISIGLLVYLIFLADPQKILATLNKIWSEGGLVYLAVGAVLFILSLLILSFRWQILITGYGVSVPLRSLFKFYLIGLFFNNFLPTGIGGDVLRIYNLVRVCGDRTISFASVITERLLGITSTLILTIFSILFLPDQFDNFYLLAIALGMLSMVILFFLIAFSERLVKPINSISARLTLLRLGERIEKFLNAIRFYADSKSIYIKILVTSLISQILIITKTYLLARALGIEVAYAYMFLVVPISFILVMLPSINGIGFRDGVYVVLLSAVGVSKAEALSLSFLALVIPMIISTAGAVLFLAQKKTTRQEEVKIVEENI
jgi:glycosyltransferase 2 family protein